MTRSTRTRGRQVAALATWLLAPLLLAAACTSSSGGLGFGDKQASFDTPEAAGKALFDAIDENDQATVIAVLGPKLADYIVTPDWDDRLEANRVISRAAAQKTVVEDTSDGAARLLLGDREWPFPIDLVQVRGGKWRFDTATGLDEIIHRRVGRNELTAIAIARTYADAQIEYAREDRDGDDFLEYAQKLISTPGERDGLYWPVEAGEALSPFGNLIEANAAYLETKGRGDAMRGYHYRVLTRQGAHPPGGRYGYVVNGRMIAGFALVAYPDEPGNSGVMTFVVNHRGVVYEKDLGSSGADIVEYDPDDSWKVPEDS